MNQPPHRRASQVALPPFWCVNGGGGGNFLSSKVEQSQLLLFVRWPPRLRCYLPTEATLSRDDSSRNLRVTKVHHCVHAEAVSDLPSHAPPPPAAPSTVPILQSIGRGSERPPSLLRSPSPLIGTAPPTDEARVGTVEGSPPPVPPPNRSRYTLRGDGVCSPTPLGSRRGRGGDDGAVHAPLDP
jgi:hypothetical protein